MVVYLDGVFLPKEEATISVDDRGFLFGDGVYEVTRAVNGQLFEEDLHWERLERGLRDLAIQADGVDKGWIGTLYHRLLEENGLLQTDATVYLQITRGVAPRAHAFPARGTKPTIYAFAAPFSIPTDLRRDGVAAITYPDVRWSRCDIKTINLLPNVVARQRAVEAGSWEAILVRDGAVTEGAVTSVFGVVNGELRTYPESNYILPGITRSVVIDLAAGLGIPVSFRPIFVEDVPGLEELFLTGTTTDIQPLTTLDGRSVGEGKRGPITEALQHALMDRMGIDRAVVG